MHNVLYYSKVYHNLLHLLAITYIFLYLVKQTVGFFFIFFYIIVYVHSDIISRYLIHIIKHKQTRFVMR